MGYVAHISSTQSSAAIPGDPPPCTHLPGQRLYSAILADRHAAVLRMVFYHYGVAVGRVQCKTHVLVYAVALRAVSVSASDHGALQADCRVMPRA